MNKPSLETNGKQITQTCKHALARSMSLLSCVANLMQQVEKVKSIERSGGEGITRGMLEGVSGKDTQCGWLPAP